MSSDTDNKGLKTTQKSRKSPPPSGLQPDAQEHISSQRITLAEARGMRDLLRGSDGSQWGPELQGRSDLECLLHWLQVLEVGETELPLTVEFITHGLRTTVIFERVPLPTPSGQV